VYPEENYVVPRTEETADFINRVKVGKYIVLFAPRQTGKTTFFQLALKVLAVEDPTYSLFSWISKRCVMPHLPLFTSSCTT